MFIGCAVVVFVLGVRAVFVSPLPGGKDLFEGNWWHLKCLVWAEFIPRPVLGYPGGKIYRDMVPRQIRTKWSLLVLKRKIQPKKGHFKNFAAQHASRDPAFLVFVPF